MLPFTEHLPSVNHCSKCCICSHVPWLTPHFTVSTVCKLQSWGTNTDLTPQSLLYHQETIRQIPLLEHMRARVWRYIYIYIPEAKAKQKTSLCTSVASHKLKADHRIFIRIPLETLMHRFPNNHYPPQVEREILARLQERLIYYENKLEKGS